MCGILPLEVEVGRFARKDKEERFCTVCQTQQIEDEYHFLYTCNKLKSLRKATLKEFIPDLKSFKKLDNRDKTKILMKEENIKHTGSFIEKMFLKRRDLLFDPNLN